MGYVIKLRKTFGSQPLIVVGAAAVVIKEQKLLLVHRLDNNLWGLPAGSKELNESLETTAFRELKEETSLEGTKPQLLTILSGDGAQYQYPNGDKIDSVTAIYQVNASGIPSGSNETKESKFFDLNNLPQDITPITQAILDKVALDY